ncbi:adenosylmethionine-8-amino-7-oxononanoate aminotransferase [Psychroflexus salarius]|uniref:Adenosylmethionine-8-amino-7-oxononanoate aminotransferase n=1 Tax=Psychroflexus salarius TaxID=1155689 RepID=A0A1M4UZC8_9FLAO|nr:adenosylmethionine--8-amino-7-oxononanoate transaminase [Psychroflexus salarius]SHE62032.1 adenosylmethionine-8-amino-7-oxononanoate aminotransferase [Psychroflexus salarius]
MNSTLEHISKLFQPNPSISARDAKHIWHPLTQHKTSGKMLAIKKAKGVWLTDESGKSYIDGIASWYTSMFGHCHPEIIEAVHHQMQTLDQIVFSGFTHEPAVNLAEALLDILPSNQQKLFFNDNGSTATEIGIKMALQYHHNQGQKRQVMLALEEGFHGDTFGAMSVSGLSVYNGAFEDHFIEVVRIPRPEGHNNAAVLAQLDQLIATEAIAGFIYEPIVQGAAAMKIYDVKALDEILKRCKKANIICIADEVMTGFGKTGTFFASDQVKTKPDIMCFSKALSAGMVPMGLTSCTKKIYKAFYDNDIAKGLFHGHTYTGNPLACAAAIASIKLLKSDAIQKQIVEIAEQHKAFACQIEQHPLVKSVRHLGVIFALDLNIEMSRYGKERNWLFQFFMEQGVFLRPLGQTIYCLPPFVINNNELAKIYASISKALKLIQEKRN